MKGKFGNPAHGHAAKHAARGEKGKSLKWPALYDHLRAKGYSKMKAAMISNGMWRKKRGLPPKSVKGTKGLVGVSKDDILSMFPELSSDVDTLRIIEAGPPERSEERSPSDRMAYRQHQTNHMEDIVGDKITKNDLPTEVSEYITALEEKVDEQEHVIDKMADRIEDLTDSLIDADNDFIIKSGTDDAVIEAAIAKADPETQGLLRVLHGRVQASEAALSKSAQEAQERFLIEKSASLPVVHVPTEGVTTKDILKTAYGVSTEYGDQVYEVLKHANHLIEQGSLFNELGAGGGQQVVAKSAEAFVAELRKANPDINEEEALAEFYSQPGNYEQAQEV